MTAQRLTPERLAEIRRAPDEGIRDIVRDSYTVMLRQLLAELDAVTRESKQYRRTLSDSQGSLHVINMYAGQISRWYGQQGLDVVDHAKRIEAERLKAHQRISAVLFPEKYSDSAASNEAEKPEARATQCGQCGAPLHPADRGFYRDMLYCADFCSQFGPAKGTNYTCPNCSHPWHRGECGFDGCRCIRVVTSRPASS